MEPVKWKKAIALLLTIFLCAASLAEAAETGDISQIDSQDAVVSAENTGSYQAYLAQYEEKEHVTEEVLLTPEQMVSPQDGVGEGNAAASLEERDGRSVIISPDGSIASWSFMVEQEGYYNISVDFIAGDGNGGSMERNLYIDGKVPFNEARGILFKREFTYTKEKTYNVLGNEILPDREELREWRTKVITSPAGYIAEPLKFYFTVGRHSISLEAVREPIIYGDIRLFRLKDAKPYEQMKAEYEEAGYARQDLPGIKIDAERPLSVSDFSVYPTTDRSSAYTDPPSVDKIEINVIGGDNWKTAGQYIRYTIDVKKSGLYTIALRYKQDISQGLSVYRRLTIDDELPFAEAASIKFTYDGSWQLKNLGNGKEDYLFYLEEGRRTLTLEVTSGEYAPILADLNAALESLGEIYRSLLMITGPEPDLYRDYNFTELLPDTIEQIRTEKTRLEKIGNEIAHMGGTEQSQVTAINNLVLQLKKMGDKPEKNIASNLTSFQSNISALGTWVMNATSQPLMLDYILVQQQGTPLAKGDTGFFGTLWYEIRRFIASFFNDYNLASAVNSGEMESIDVWIATGRDQAQIVRSMIDSRFIPQEKVAVNLRLVAAGTLMPAILAGKGPDVSLGAASTEPINLAIRNAVLDLTEFPDCEDIFSRFHTSALTPFTFRDAVYALPETQSFLMMFYRTDILQELGLEPPNTWDELFACMLELQTNNLNVGLPAAYNGFLMFLTQQGGRLYSEDARTSLLGSDEALSTFKTLTDFYVLYGFPVQYDFATRFRSGEMPIAIQEYTAYNQLVLFAPEIKGVWKMAPVPGTRNGEIINRSSVGTVTGTVIMKQTKQKENCWRFLKWWTSQEIQSEFGIRMESVLGESAKYATANMSAMEGYSWSHSDLIALQDQWKSVTGIPEVPGGYYSSRYVEFAFNKVINQSADPVQTLENYVPTVTAELQRKLKEFGY